MLNLTKEQCTCRSQRGFSIVEVLVVMVIMGVVMTAVMSLYIPVVRSTSVQTQLSDVQANMRLAMNRMTQDLILAGFLVRPGDVTGGGAAGAIFWEGDVSLKDTDDLTIRTRTIGNSFARVIAYDSGELGLSDADMALAFPPGTSVRLFEPVTAEEVDGVVYSVTGNTATATINTVTYPVLTVTPSPPDVPKETVVLKVRDNAQPPMQTIRYRVNNGALERIVNGSTQILARNVESVLFNYVESTTGSVKRVDITLTGEPVGLSGGGAESNVKNRQLRTSVALRNVY
jgi:prepilin-type N-terminal cleavage/methylation domain-containing protein